MKKPLAKPIGRPSLPPAPLAGSAVAGSFKRAKASLLSRTALPAPQSDDHFSIEDIVEAQPGLPDDLPAELVENYQVVIRDGEADLTETLVRRLVETGSDIEFANSYAEAVIAADVLKHKLGRRRLGPRLRWKRGSIYIVDGDHWESTGHEVEKDSGYTHHSGALTKLGRYVGKRIRRILGRVLTSEISVKEVFAEWRAHHRPGSAAFALDQANYDGVCADLKGFEAFAGSTRFDRLPSTAGKQYSEHYCGLRFGSKKKVPPAKLMSARETACDHIESANMVFAWFADEHGCAVKRLSKPKRRHRGVLTLSWDQLVRLIRAARGEAFDKFGKRTGKHAEAARFACVLRYILLYLYGGVRGANILELRWGKHPVFGHIDAKREEIERQGDLAEITTKRRYASTLLGSLRTLVPQWKAEDKAARKLSGGRRYLHVIHDENGRSLARKDKYGRSSNWAIRGLFARVCRYAGLPDVTAHILKATGTTFCVRAGMPTQQVMIEFSTSWDTLYKRYVNLRPYLGQIRRFKKKDLRLLSLRKFSSPDDAFPDEDA
jgi:integrase